MTSTDAGQPGRTSDELTRRASETGKTGETLLEWELRSHRRRAEDVIDEFTGHAAVDPTYAVEWHADKATAAHFDIRFIDLVERVWQELNDPVAAVRKAVDVMRVRPVDALADHVGKRSTGDFVNAVALSQLGAKQRLWERYGSYVA